MKLFLRVLNTALIIYLILKSNQIMATLQEALDKVKELSDKADALQVTVDAEQEQVKALVATNAEVVTDLNAQIVALQAIIDVGGTAADFQPVIDAVQAVIAKVEQASADVDTTV